MLLVFWNSKDHPNYQTRSYFRLVGTITNNLTGRISLKHGSINFRVLRGSHGPYTLKPLNIAGVLDLCSNVI